MIPRSSYPDTPGCSATSASSTSFVVMVALPAQVVMAAGARSVGRARAGCHDDLCRERNHDDEGRAARAGGTARGSVRVRASGDHPTRYRVLVPDLAQPDPVS